MDLGQLAYRSKTKAGKAAGCSIRANHTEIRNGLEKLCRKGESNSGNVGYTNKSAVDAVSKRVYVIRRDSWHRAPSWATSVQQTHFLRIPINVFSLEVSLSSTPEAGIVDSAGVLALDVCCEDGAEAAGVPAEEDGMLHDVGDVLGGRFGTGSVHKYPAFYAATVIHRGRVRAQCMSMLFVPLHSIQLVGEWERCW